MQGAEENGGGKGGGSIEELGGKRRGTVSMGQ